MGDKRNPELLLNSTYMHNCPPCYCPSCYHHSGNMAAILVTRRTAEQTCGMTMHVNHIIRSAQSEHANASAAEFVCIAVL